MPFGQSPKQYTSMRNLIYESESQIQLTRYLFMLQLILLLHCQGLSLFYHIAMLKITFLSYNYLTMLIWQSQPTLESIIVLF